MKLRVSPMGEKLGLYLPKKLQEEIKLSKGDYVSIKVTKNNKAREFLAKFNHTMAIKKVVCRELNLCPNEIIEIKIDKAMKIKSSKNLFHENKIDLLYLIENMGLERSLFTILSSDKGEEFLKIWSCHNRGSCREVILKRFMGLDIFGRLLGQLQAEGTKEYRFRLEFVNKSIQEHKDYLSYLRNLGIASNQIKAGLISHPEILGSIDVSEFESKTGIKINSISKSQKSRKGYGYRIYIGSSIIADILLGSMDYLRNLMAHSEWDDNLKRLAESFFAKLLNGDGTLDLMEKNRKTPQIRVRIVDQRLSYLEDYAAIMRKLGFNPKINKKYIFVRSYANLENLLFLKNIKAFYGNPNWNKLIDGITRKSILNQKQRPKAAFEPIQKELKFFPEAQLVSTGLAK